jgi:hypothetical protein
VTGTRPCIGKNLQSRVRRSRRTPICDAGRLPVGLLAARREEDVVPICSVFYRGFISIISVLS